MLKVEHVLPFCCFRIFVDKGNKYVRRETNMLQPVGSKYVR